MKKAIVAAAFTVVGLIGSVNVASAACTWGSWSWSTNVQGSFNSNYAPCASPNSWAGIFRGRVWLQTPCTLGKGCRKVTAQRENDAFQCTLPGIGMQARGNRFNENTGGVEIDTLAVNETQLTCNNPRTAESVGWWWWTTAKCRMAWGC